jgi:hypothetical protein
MSLERLRQLRTLVAAGASLLGEPPRATPGLAEGPHADAELRRLVAELWGEAREQERPFGRGRVFRGLAPEAVLARLGVARDFDSSVPVSWIHRSSPTAEIYFVASAAAEPVTARCTFRVHGRPGELWDPETGQRRPLDVAFTPDGRTAVDLALGPSGSAFVVFPTAGAQSVPPRAAGTGRERNNATPAALRTVQTLVGPWTVAFPAGSGAPAQLPVESLFAWNHHADPQVRHFSGTAIYRHTFTAPATSGRIELDLGRVEIMARVRLNQRDLGILWKPPYRVDLTEAIHPGPNQLEIAVVNLWVNRLIGDAALPEDAEREKNGRLIRWPDWVLAGKASPAGRQTFVTFPLWKKEEPLRDSGLLGPVTVSHASGAASAR